LDFRTLFAGQPWKHRSERPVVGLDLGSRASKGVLLHGEQFETVLVPTGVSTQKTADEVIGKLLRKAGLERRALRYVVGTGYGRITLAFHDIPYQVVTEITCHALGAHAVLPATRTIIDIGGQDSKAIKIDPANGKVVEFVMNDKCAAGTGRFLEKTAVMLGLQLDELGEVALEAVSPSPISSQCVVFAESEVISLRAKGERSKDSAVRANVAAGVHLATARRVHNLLNRVGIEPALAFTGGVSNNRGMWKLLEELLGHRFAQPPLDLIFAGALGAAIFAGRYEQTGVGNPANFTNTSIAANKSDWHPFSGPDVKVEEDRPLAASAPQPQLAQGA
jgi:predicted CoA-substrate-specific enzyme activase